MNDNIMDMNVMNMKQTVERAKASGINISEYTLRRAIRITAAREQLAEEIRILYVAMTRARERLILFGEAGAKKREAFLRAENSAAQIRAMQTGLDMVCPMLAQHGAALNLREEVVCCGDSCWRVFAHHGGAALGRAERSDESVMRLIARLESTAIEDETLVHLLDFQPGGSRAAVRKTSVSSVIRDEKRAAQLEEGEAFAPRETEIMRLPRFMTDKTMTGAQIGTAFHRAMCMIDLTDLPNVQVGDEVEILSFVLHHPLLVMQVWRSGQSLGQFTAARISGLSSVRVI